MGAPTTSKRVAIYTRVSTDDQTTENQRRELLAVAERHGWTVVAEFTDQGVSGAKGRDKRPAFDRLLKAATRREFDVIAAWSVDRLGRSLQHLVDFLSEIHAAGVDLFLHQQGLDTSTPAGKAMFGMLGIFAEFERAMIVARVRSGIARAKAKGVKLGRPKIDAKMDRAIRAALAESSKSHRVIARELGTSHATVYRTALDMRDRVHPYSAVGLAFVPPGAKPASV